MVHKIPPVTFEDLKRLFRSRMFSQRLGNCARYTNRNGYEAGFKVYRNAGSRKLLCGPACEGGTDDVFLDMLSIDDEFDGYSILRHHFHPNDSGVVLFSDQDLAQLNDFNELIVDDSGIFCPILSIGHTRADLSIDMLLIQKREDKHFTNNHIDIYFNLVDDMLYTSEVDVTTADVAALLSNNGLNAIALTDIRRQDGRYAFSEEDLQKLKVFEYDPMMR